MIVFWHPARIEQGGGEYASIADLVTQNPSVNFEDLDNALGQAWQLWGQRYAQALRAPIDPGQIAELNATIGQLQQELTEAKTKLAPAINQIVPALLDAGLLAWGNAATTAAGSIGEAEGKAVMALVLRLRDIALQPPYRQQCQGIKDTFGLILHLSGVAPTSAQSAAMQAILDVGTPSTGPVLPEHLNFHPWIVD